MAHPFTECPFCYSSPTILLDAKYICPICLVSITQPRLNRKASNNTMDYTFSLQLPTPWLCLYPHRKQL